MTIFLDIPPNILKFNSSVDKNDIREGTDVELHCEVQSNLLNAPTINFQHNVSNIICPKLRITKMLLG